MEKDFVFENKSDSNFPDEFEINVESPSNIAIVKYWGKRENQLPLNPSISFTLNECKTISNILFSKKNNSIQRIELFFEKQRNKEFEEKTKIYINNITEYCPYLLEYDILINTKNTFPHSSGIASSASSMSALAVGIMSLERKIVEIDEDFFLKKTSFLARLGSGSASRSISGSVMLWGKSEYLESSSDFYAVNMDFKIHKIFDNFQDTILIIDKEEKKVLSTKGHLLMKNHDFSESRFLQAKNNIKFVLKSLREGDLNLFGTILENEALTLHSMMMTSKPWFILIKPNTLKAIDEIKNFREDTELPLYFTLDAGANLHLMYPNSIRDKILNFIEKKLKILCFEGNYVKDSLGVGFKIKDNN